MFHATASARKNTLSKYVDVQSNLRGGLNRCAKLSDLCLLPGLAAIASAAVIVVLDVLPFGITLAGPDPILFTIAAALIGLACVLGANQTGGAHTLEQAQAADLTDRLEDTQAANAELHKALALAHSQLSRLMAERDNLEVQLTIDPLTGVQNRRGLEDTFQAHGAGTVMALLDLDHFKAINDRLGHDVGDRVLKAFARMLRARLNDSLPIYRIGGEEFAVFFPRGQLSKIAALLDDFRNDLRDGAFTRMEDPVEISFSAGLAMFDGSATTFQQVYKRADERLYAAKEAGRARTMYADVAQRGAVCETLAIAG